MDNEKVLSHRELSLLQDALFDRLSDDREAADLWYRLQCLKVRREERQPEPRTILSRVRAEA